MQSETSASLTDIVLAHSFAPRTRADLYQLITRLVHQMSSVVEPDSRLINIGADNSRTDDELQREEKGNSSNKSAMSAIKN